MKKNADKVKLGKVLKSVNVDFALAQIKLLSNFNGIANTNLHNVDFAQIAEIILKSGKKIDNLSIRNTADFKDMPVKTNFWYLVIDICKLTLFSRHVDSETDIKKMYDIFKKALK